MIATTRYDSHPISKIFPEMSGDDKKELIDDIRKNGLQEPIILFEGKILDGRNRQQACATAGIEPSYVEFEKLGTLARTAGPVAYVISRNLKRRHLTPSQRAVIAAEALPMFETEAKKRREGGVKIDETLAPKGAKGESAPPPVKGKASEQAAKAAGVSARSVERAKALKKKSPKKFEEVKAGKRSVTSANRDKKKEAAAAKAAAKEAQGFTVKNSIGDLIKKARASSRGVKGKGLRIKIEDATITVAIKKGGKK